MDLEQLIEELDIESGDLIGGSFEEYEEYEDTMSDCSNIELMQVESSPEPLWINLVECHEHKV